MPYDDGADELALMLDADTESMADDRLMVAVPLQNGVVRLPEGQRNEFHVTVTVTPLGAKIPWGGTTLESWRT